MIPWLRRRFRSLSPRSWRNLLALVAPFALGLALVIGFGGEELLTAERVRDEVLALGAVGLVAFLLASLVRPLLVIISSSVFSVAAGMVWGPLTGTLLAGAGALLSSGLVLWLARSLGQGAVRELAGEKWNRLAAGARSRGFAFVFVASLGYALPTDLVVAVASTTGVRKRSILAGSVLGALPGHAAMVTIGASFTDPRAAPWWIGAGAAVALTTVSLVLAHQLYRRRPAAVGGRATWA